jgi:hypothetical protein
MTAPIPIPVKKARRFPLPEWYLPKGTINASDSDLEGASSSCERWGLGFAGLVVVSVIAELAIAWAAPPYLLFLRLSAVADGGIAIGIVGEIALGTIWNNRIQTELRKRSNEKVADANKRAEIALVGAKRAFEATEPRKINPEEFKKFIEMGTAAKAKILYERAGDCIFLAVCIRAALMKAGWGIPVYKPLDEPVGDKAHLSAAMAAGGGVNGGVTLLGKSPLDFVDFKKPFAALRAALICGGVGSDSALTTMADDTLSEGLFRIIIAPRP